MYGLPAGTVTFLFTDIEESTVLWEGDPEAMRAACARHDALLEACAEQCGAPWSARLLAEHPHGQLQRSWEGGYDERDTLVRRVA